MKVELTEFERKLIINSLPYSLKKPIPGMNPMFYFMLTYEDDLKLYELCESLRDKLNKENA